MMWKARGLLAVFAIGICAVPVWADVYSFDASGKPDSDGNASASVTITTSSTGLIVALTSLEVNPTGAGQLVSGILITLGGTPTSASLSSEAGQLIDIGGTPQVASNVSGNPTHWSSSIVSGSVCLETAGQSPGCAPGMTPKDMIIGAGDYATDYSNANSSITGNHSPTINGTGTFDISLAGLSGDPTVTSVIFEFGTGPDGSLPGVCTSSPTDCANGGTVPEPTSILLLGTVLAFVGAFRRRAL